MLDFFCPKQELKYIIYLAANNIYGYTMSKFLPTGKFKWINPKDFDSNNYGSTSSKRCVLEADFEYPKKFCDLLNDYSLAPDKIEIKQNCLSMN